MTNPSARLHDLSRFFFAATAADLREAYEALAASGLALPPVSDWAEAAFCFNRLFVGPKALAAPPYATVYLDGDATRLMGASTARVRQLYDMLGLTSPWENKIPDDHIAFELDALWQISHALQSVVSPQLKDAQAYLHEHLRAWVPAFVERIRAAPDPHPSILAVADALLKSMQAADPVGAY